MKVALEEALEVQGEAREHVLARAGAANPELRREVEELLAGERSPAQLTAAVASVVVDLADGSEEGARVGPYRLEELVGRGGMGTVYRARRADGQYDARVAVKLARRDLPGAEAAARFRLERQFLAPLEHPNIARLLDGGVSADGRLYLVMEYVDGVPIDEHCRAGAVGLEARLALVRKVCSAVEYAHQRLIVHRDLKPSNVLVGADGTPKLVDFGVAKLLAPLPGGHAPTQDATRYLTPGYASPEHLAGGQVTTASDVFSLGVLLHELLAGSLPWPPDAGPGERSPSGAEPIPLSAAAARAGDGRGTGAGGAAVETRRLAGDLDVIVAKALRNAPEERYRSVAELDEDLRRFLEGEPIRARPATLAYRTGRWVGRHRTLAAVLLASTLLVMAGVVASVWEAHRATQAATVAARAEQRSRKRFEDLRRLAHAVIFDYSDAIERLSGSVEVRERLVQDALAYLDGLASDAAGEADLQLELARAYLKIGDIQGNLWVSNLGRVAAAAQSYQRAVALLDAAYREAPGDAARQLELGEALAGPVAFAAFSRNEVGEALAALERAERLAGEASQQQPADPRVLKLQTDVERAWADAATAVADATAVRAHAERACERAEAHALAARAPPLELEVARAYCDDLRSFALAPLGLHQQAVALERAAVTRIEQLARAHPEDAYRTVDLAVFQARLAEQLADGDEPAEAAGLSREAAGSMAVLLDRNRQNGAVRYRTSEVLRARARVLLALGQADAALESSGLALTLARELDATAGGTVTYVLPLGVAEALQGEVLARRGDRAGAGAAFREAAETFGRLTGAPEHRQARWLQARARAQAALAGGDREAAALEESVASMAALASGDGHNVAKQRELARWYQRLSLWHHEPPPSADGCTRSPWLARAGQVLRELQRSGAWLGADDRLVARGPCR